MTTVEEHLSYLKGGMEEPDRRLSKLAEGFVGLERRMDGLDAKIARFTGRSCRQSR